MIFSVARQEAHIWFRHSGAIQVVGRLRLQLPSGHWCGLFIRTSRARRNLTESATLIGGVREPKPVHCAVVFDNRADTKRLKPPCPRTSCESRRFEQLLAPQFWIPLPFPGPHSCRSIHTLRSTPHYVGHWQRLRPGLSHPGRETW